MTLPATHHKPTFDNIPKEKRDRILRVATCEFAANGFENTSIESIARKAGISVGSIYKYFENKDELFTTVAHMGIARLDELLTSLYETDEDIIIKVEKILRELISFSREEPEFIKLYCVLASSGHNRISEVAYRMEALSAKIYTQSIKQAQQTGDVRGDINPEFFAFLIDNIFMMLQFSYSCDYYKERLELYCGEDIAAEDDFVVEQVLKFVKAAFNFKK